MEARAVPAELRFEADEGTSASAQSAGRDARPTICFPFAGGLVGGSHISALKLIKMLDRSPFRPLVVLHSQEGAWPRMLAGEGIATEAAPVPSRFAPGWRPRPSEIGALARDIGAMTRFLKARNVAIVHTNDGTMHATWTLPARLAGARHVWHHRGRPTSAGLRLLAPLLATRVLAVSRYASPPSGLFSAHRKCSVVYSPFDTDLAAIDRPKARAKVRSSLGFAEDMLILAFVGQFQPRKRPLVFVETVAALRRIAPRLPVAGLMFGEESKPGQEQALRERIRALGMDDTVWLMGFQRPIEPWMAAADLLVVPALEEPFGRTLIEAMLIGVPVLAAAHGGNVEAIRHGETGLLAAPDDLADFTRQALDLLSSPALASGISALAQREALGRFGLDVHLRRVLQSYREALAA